VVEQDQEHEKQPESGKDENIEVLLKSLAEAKAQAEANMAGWQRAQADFVNYKRFVEQEKLETSKYANASCLTAILPIFDDLDRALANVPHSEHEHKKAWVEGFRLIERKYKDALEKLGLTCIKTVGEEFDCRTMDALTCTPGKKDIVLQELEKGYKLQDKVIRPAKVIVGSGEEVNKEE
jgi:molecular chaperone GrpE